jgi:hypothetical protein
VPSFWHGRGRGGCSDKTIMDKSNADTQYPHGTPALPSIDLVPFFIQNYFPRDWECKAVML